MFSTPTSNTRQLLFLLTLAAFASSASFRVCDPMLPQLAGQFAASTAEVALIITSFTIAYGAMQLIYGPLGERFERFRIVTRATALCAAGSLGAALAPNLEMLTACRILTGVAAAGIIPMSMATVSDLVPAEQRQATLARLFSGQILGMVFGQVLGGLCVDFGLWRLAFGVLTGLYLLIAFALWRRAHLGATTRGAAGPAGSMASLYRRLCHRYLWSLLKARAQAALLAQRVGASLLARGGETRITRSSTRAVRASSHLQGASPGWCISTDNGDRA